MKGVCDAGIRRCVNVLVFSVLTCLTGKKKTAFARISNLINSHQHLSTTITPHQPLSTSINEQQIMKKNKTKLSVFLLSICLMAAGAWAQPVLVKDIDPGSSSGIFLGAAKSTAVGKYLYFTGNTAVGTELWRSDGTEAGTQLVKDIYAGTIQDGIIDFLGEFDRQLYFKGNESATGTEVWRTTDDTNGAALLIDACPGNCSDAISPIIDFNNQLFVGLWGGSGIGNELFVSDGTTAGTKLFLDVNKDGSSRPFNFIVHNNKLFFTADTSRKGREPWISDGTPAGTKMLKDINPGFDDSDVSGFRPIGNTLFFFADDDVNGFELWKTDGTQTGTQLVADIAKGSADGIYVYENIKNTLEYNSNLLFIANDGTTGPELWITDGTAAGTKLVKDINVGSSGSSIYFKGVLNGLAVFQATTTTNGSELWVTDGTSTGTKLLKEIGPGANDGLGFDAAALVFQKTMYFTANNGTAGRELWVTDGTSAGTKMLHDIITGSNESNPSNYTMIGTNLLFFANTTNKGRELWKLDLSSVSTHEPQAAELLRIMPTITSDGQFYVQITELAQSSGGLDLRIVNAQGQVLGQSNINESGPLDLSRLPKGFYFVQVLTKDLQYRAVQKIITH